MATLTVQTIVQDGLTVTKTVLYDDNLFDNSGNYFLLYTNSSGGSQNLTFTAVTTSIDSPIYGSLTKGNIVFAVANGDTVTVGPFPPTIFNNSSGQVSFSISNRTAGDSAALLKIG